MKDHARFTRCGKHAISGVPQQQRWLGPCKKGTKSVTTVMGYNSCGMRVVLALMGLVYGAAGALALPADNIPYCSETYDPPARLTFADDGETLSVTIDGKTRTLNAHEPLDGGGVSFSTEGITEEDEGAAVYSVTIGNTEVVIYNDRVFWPCKNQ